MNTIKSMLQRCGKWLTLHECSNVDHCVITRFHEAEIKMDQAMPLAFMEGEVMM